MSGPQLTILAGIAATLLVLVAGITLVTKPQTAPLSPYVPVAGVEEVQRPALDHDRGILFVRDGGDIKAFDAEAVDIDFCADSGRIESADGGVWNLAGTPLNGRPPLEMYPVTVYDEVVYVDLSGTRPAPAGGSQGAEPACANR